MKRTPSAPDELRAKAAFADTPRGSVCGQFPLEAIAKYPGGHAGQGHR